jgi:tetratricopeptide (TPR) repeat protein
MSSESTIHQEGPIPSSPDEKEALAMLEQRIGAGDPDAELLTTYYQKLLSLYQVERGKSFLAPLVREQPGHHQLLSIYIAVCLKANDHDAAMAAIEDLMGAGAPDDALLDAALSVREKTGKRIIASPDPSRATLSLCMIVKNEQAGLGGCLNAAKSMVDEIIVVDTGSTDRTRDVARIFGAHTVEFQWGRDFAAARNVSLEQARGQWILILDADEAIAAQDQEKIRNLIAQYHDRPAAFSISTRNYSHLANTVGWQANDGRYPGYEAGMGWFPSKKIRLFPRHEKHRFRYPVHEMVEPALREAGLPIVDCDIPVHHYGHLNEAKNQQKAKTYFDLGYAKLDQMGDDPAAIRELAVQAGQLEYWAESLTLWEKLLDLKPGFSEGHINAAGACWQMARYDLALSYARKAVELAPDHKEAKYNLAVSLLLLKNAEAAIPVLVDLVKTHAGYLAAHFMLAAALACAGHFDKSMLIFQELHKTSAGPALPMALDDLGKRLGKNNLTTYHDAIVRIAKEMSGHAAQFSSPR